MSDPRISETVQTEPSKVDTWLSGLFRALPHQGPAAKTEAVEAPLPPGFTTSESAAYYSSSLPAHGTCKAGSGLVLARSLQDSQVLSVHCPTTQAAIPASIPMQLQSRLLNSLHQLTKTSAHMAPPNSDAVLVIVEVPPTPPASSRNSRVSLTNYPRKHAEHAPTTNTTAHVSHTRYRDSQTRTSNIFSTRAPARQLCGGRKKCAHKATVQETESDVNSQRP